MFIVLLYIARSRRRFFTNTRWRRRSSSSNDNDKRFNKIGRWTVWNKPLLHGQDNKRRLGEITSVSEANLRSWSETSRSEMEPVHRLSKPVGSGDLFARLHHKQRPIVKDLKRARFGNCCCQKALRCSSITISDAASHTSPFFFLVTLAFQRRCWFCHCICN